MFAVTLSLTHLTIDLPKVEMNPEISTSAQDPEMGKQMEIEIYNKVKAVKPTKPDPDRTQPSLRLYRAFKME